MKIEQNQEQAFHERGYEIGNCYFDFCDKHHDLKQVGETKGLYTLHSISQSIIEES